MDYTTNEAIPFVVDKKADINRTGLLTMAIFDKQMLRLILGSHTKIFFDACQRRRKYSDHVIVRHKETGEVFTLYMCYGRTRIGGKMKHASSLGLLLASLNPQKYDNCVGKSVEELTSNIRSGGPR